jgi:cation:H+ antiporter
LRLSPVSSKRFQVILVVVGLFLLAIGGKMTIDHGTVLATLLGVSPVIIGMFVVAIGTSLPELVTSVMAALKGQADLCVGNVVGSNLFNSMFVLPVTAVILPIELPPGGTIDLFASFAIALWLFPIFIFGKTIMNRATGALFLGIYFAYVALRLAQSI